MKPGFSESMELVGLSTNWNNFNDEQKELINRLGKRAVASVGRLGRSGHE